MRLLIEGLVNMILLPLCYVSNVIKIQPLLIISVIFIEAFLFS